MMAPMTRQVPFEDDGGTPGWRARHQRLTFRQKVARMTGWQLFFLPWAFAFLVMVALIIVVIGLELFGVIR
jgi:hypothetical protein